VTGRPKGDTPPKPGPTVKTDPVTGEEFECSGGEGHCWCYDYPQVIAVQGDECVGPTRLKRLVEAKTGSGPGDPSK